MTGIPQQNLYQSKSKSSGRVAEDNPINFVRSFAAEEVIPFGLAVMQGSTGEQVKIFANPAGIFLGIAAYSDFASNLDIGGYGPGDALGVAQGVYFVNVEEAVAPGQPVRVRHTVNGTKTPGFFATTADAGKTVVLHGAEFRGSTSGAGEVAIFLNPVYSTTAD